MCLPAVLGRSLGLSPQLPSCVRQLLPPQLSNEALCEWRERCVGMVSGGFVGLETRTKARSSILGRRLCAFPLSRTNQTAAARRHYKQNVPVDAVVGLVPRCDGHRGRCGVVGRTEREACEAFACRVARLPVSLPSRLASALARSCVNVGVVGRV